MIGVRIPFPADQPEARTPHNGYTEPTSSRPHHSNGRPMACYESPPRTILRTKGINNEQSAVSSHSTKRWYRLSISLVYKWTQQVDLSYWNSRNLSHCLKTFRRVSIRKHQHRVNLYFPTSIYSYDGGEYPEEDKRPKNYS